MVLMALRSLTVPQWFMHINKHQCEHNIQAMLTNVSNNHLQIYSVLFYDTYEVPLIGNKVNFSFSSPSTPDFPHCAALKWGLSCRNMLHHKIVT